MCHFEAFHFFIMPVQGQCCARWESRWTDRDRKQGQGSPFLPARESGLSPPSDPSQNPADSWCFIKGLHLNCSNLSLYLNAQYSVLLLVAMLCIVHLMLLYNPQAHRASWKLTGVTLQIVPPTTTVSTFREPAGCFMWDTCCCQTPPSNALLDWRWSVRFPAGGQGAPASLSSSG